MTLDSKAFILDDFEKQIEREYEAGERETVENLEERKEILKIIAGNTLKRKSITIRPFGQDIVKLKAIAAHEWIPYQSKIVSILHQYVREYWKDKGEEK